MIGSNRRWLAQVTVVIAAICFLSAGAFAQGQGQGQGGQRGNRGQGQGQGGGRQMGPAMIDRLHAAVNELNLTDEQKPKIDEIFTKAKDEFEKMQPELQDLPMQERGAKAREFAQKLQTDVKAVLNDEQKAAFDKKLAEAQAQRGQGQGQGGGQGGQIRRIREAVDALGLTDEQKPKVEAILKDTEEKVQQARQESQGDQDAFREKARAIGQDTITQLESVLTPEQQQKLRETMRANRGGGQGGGARRGDGAGAGPATKPADGMNPPATQPAKDNKAGAMLPPGNSPGAPPGAPPSAQGRLEVGQAAPDFQIKKLDGTPVQLSSFRGKILLVTFGSFTSPSFRQRAAALDELRREYSARVSFLVVYTREAHPAGSWEVERNRDEEISIADHKDEAGRRTVAREAQNRLHLGQISFTTDAMRNATADAYHAFPNAAAVLIGKDSTVLAYQQWFDAYTMRPAILDALAPKPQSTSSR